MRKEKKSEHILGKKASIIADDKPKHSFTITCNTIQLQFFPRHFSAG